jgi:hypothetical protein
MTINTLPPAVDPVTIDAAALLAPAQIRAYEDEGYVLLPGLISPEAAETPYRLSTGSSTVRACARSPDG